MGPSRDSRKTTILVVEDEGIVRRLAVTGLSARGYRVLSTDTAEEAERIFERERDAIQLVVTDVMLSDSDGRDLADRLRTAEPALRVLYTSGYPMTHLSAPERFAEPGVGFLEKPYTLAELAEKISEEVE